MVSPSQRIAGVGHLVNHQICSERKASQTLLVCRSHYRKKQKKHSTREEQAILEASEAKPTWGIRKITSYLRARHVTPISHKRVEWIRRANNLQAYTKRKARRRAKISALDEQRKQASSIDEIWSYDFKQDRTREGRKARILVICDEYSHECLLLDSARSYRSGQVLETLARLMETTKRKPRYIRSDNGSEFKNRMLEQWLLEQGIEPIYTKPGSPWQNGYVESLNASLGRELLNREIFENMQHLQTRLEQWRREYNEERPHGSCGNTPPSLYAGQLQPSTLTIIKPYFWNGTIFGGQSKKTVDSAEIGGTSVIVVPMQRTLMPYYCVAILLYLLFLISKLLS